MNILSFDVGGTSIKYGLVDSNFRILNKGSVDTPKTEENFIEIINSIISDNELSLIHI